MSDAKRPTFMGGHDTSVNAENRIGFSKQLRDQFSQVGNPQDYVIFLDKATPSLIIMDQAEIIEQGFEASLEEKFKLDSRGRFKPSSEILEAVGFGEGSDIRVMGVGGHIEVIEKSVLERILKEPVDIDPNDFPPDFRF